MTASTRPTSITICAFTTDETEAPLFRLPVEPNERNGLRAACRLMVDKITTVPKSKVGAHVGRLDDEDILRLNQAVLVFLGLAVSLRRKQASPDERSDIRGFSFFIIPAYRCAHAGLLLDAATGKSRRRVALRYTTEPGFVGSCDDDQ